MSRTRKRIMLYAVTAAIFFIAVGTANASTMIGMIAETNDEGFALYTDRGIRFASITADTAWDTDEIPTVGDVITIHSADPDDRIMQRADTVICHKIRGTVSEIFDSDEPYLIMTSIDSMDDICVDLGYTVFTGSLVPGIPVTVYYNGIRTRSIPPRITADYIRGFEIQGSVTGFTNDGDICLLKDDGETVLLRISNETIMPIEIVAGNRVNVSVLPHMRLSIPLQYEVQDILPIDNMKERNPS